MALLLSRCREIRSTLSIDFPLVALISWSRVLSGCFWVALERSRVLLGRSRARLGCSRGAFGWSWGGLGCSWGALELVMGALWAWLLLVLLGCQSAFRASRLVPNRGAQSGKVERVGQNHGPFAILLC